MDSASHDRLREVFVHACTLQEGERIAYLDEACAGDEALRWSVDRLLEADSKNNALDADELAFVGGSPASGLFMAAQPPSEIGDYSVVGVLGEGGMGVVFDALQEHPARRVAIKMLRSSPTAEMAARLQNEGQALALLDHPCIAKVIETGVTPGDAARPFLVMEFVDGVPLTTFTRDRLPTLEQRLGMFIQICDAVHHAHQRGVIHRDIKPSNIMVDGEGQPRVLDFGVAHLAEHESRASTFVTGAGQILGTIPYMSPEQVRGDDSGADVRTDVYALGVLLFELLTDRLPLDLDGLSVLAAARVIEHDEPRRLSSINAGLRGDLESIVTNAIEKRKEDRYQSVADLKADIIRYLRHEPVAARRPSTLYLARKFVRRHRAETAVAVTVLVSLTIGLVVVSLLLVQVNDLRRDEARALAQATTVKDFLIDMIQPTGDGEHDLTVVEAVDRGAERFDTQFSDQPLLRAELSALIGTMYQNLGRLESARSFLTTSLGLHTELYGPDADPTLRVRLDRALLLADEARWDDVLTEAEATRSLAAGTLGLDDDLTLSAQILQADALQVLARYDEAEPILRDALERVPEGSNNQLVGLNILGALLVALERYEEAEPIVRDENRATRRTFGESHLNSLASNHNLASLLARLGKLNEAVGIMTGTIETALGVLPETHWRMGYFRRQHGNFLGLLGENAQAMEELTSARQIFVDTYGEDHWEVVLTDRYIVNQRERAGGADQATAPAGG